ncbi:hypothetical protein [Actinomadura verrucosospora]|uniref:Integral membrane protein n=1 Tax=Actinomadura verrucosospora TaxID=46165 RepID=A0A7D4A3V3_ACTVE|nr:hypothetical protein [Actinomadura verrucosospora]QKG19727.1 integral membrane protein [Actinomadura verrucosospora]
MPTAVNAPPRTDGADRAVRWVTAVALAFTAAQLRFVPAGMTLGAGEVGNVWQARSGDPGAFLDVSRGHATVALVAPIVQATSSTAAMRIYLAVASGAGLFAALWAWRPLHRPETLAGAGVLFGGLWAAQLYGSQAMPDLWCALGALGAVGCLLRVARDRQDYPAMLGVTASLALVAAMRPSQGLWLALPLCAALAVVPAWRHREAVVSVLAGLVLDLTAWLVHENGGAGPEPVQRVQRAAARGSGWVDGWPGWSGFATVAVFLAIGGLMAVSGVRRPGTALLPMAVAAWMLVPGALAGPGTAGFLLTAGALAAVPAAAGCVRALTRARRRPLAAALTAGCLVAHLAVQNAALDAVTDAASAVPAAHPASGQGAHAPGEGDARADGAGSDGIRS